MKSLERIKIQARATGKELAYSPLGRRFARVITMAPDALPVKQFLETKGLDDYVRRLASEGLPDGKYYAKLTIGRWAPWEGKVIRLLHGDEVVFSTVVLPPAHGMQLVFRNIIVSAGQASEFTMDTDVPFKLAISRGAFTTQQQKDHEEKYQVSENDDLYYAVRGNTRNPSRLIVAFPEHSAPSAAIAYRVNPLAGISDDDLASTLVLSFQDRYLHNGSYLTVDNSGRDLSRRVAGVIESLRLRHEISPGQVMLTGKYAGASMAILHAKSHPEAQLLLVAPHLTLEHQSPVEDQPSELLHAYINKGRQIDYLSTEADHWNVAGLAEGGPTVMVYRMSGGASIVAKAVNVTQKAILRKFIDPKPVRSFRCEEAQIHRTGESIQVQLRVDKSASAIENGSWFVGGVQSGTRFLQLISGHALPFVKYTSGDQLIVDGPGRETEISSAIAIASDSSRWEAVLPADAKYPQGSTRDHLAAMERAMA